MIDEIRFSDRGQGVTDFELRLIAQSRSDSAWLHVARRLMSDLGVEQGARALVLVLDELSGEKVHVTPRRSFFERLWAIERDALIQDLVTRQDWSHSDISRHLGVSRQYVSRIAGRRQPRGPRDTRKP